MIETDGNGQIVRLPEAFRLPGTEVRVSRNGDAVLLQPIRPRLPREDIDAILDELKRLAVQDGPFMPEGREQPPMPDDDEPNPFDTMP